MSQNLPSIIQVTRDNYVTFAAFLQDCTKYSYGSTFKYTTEPTSYAQADFFNWLQAEVLYVLVRNNKSIGYVVIHENTLGDESLVNFTTFLHPRVCKMAAISLLRGALCIASLYAVINKASVISTFLYHKVMVATVRQIFTVSTKSTHLTDSCELCQVIVGHLTLDALVAKLKSTFSDEELEEYLALF